MTYLFYCTSLLGAVSYAHLIPDTVPEVRIVNQWPGQPEAAGDSKVLRNPFLPMHTDYSYLLSRSRRL